MERILELLKEKNHYLAKFYKLNEEGVLNFADGDFSSLETFYQSRDSILNMIRIIDSKLEEANRKFSEMEVTESFRKEIKGLLIEKDELVTRILAQDLQILSYIEKEKSNIIRELRGLKRARRAIGAYHSGESTPRLDEKA